MKLAKLTLTLLLFTPTAFAVDQGTRGGGDAYALEFTAVGKRLVKLFRENKSAREALGNVDLSALEVAVDNTLVETKDQLFLGAREVDAINDPAANTIELSRSRWKVADLNNSLHALVLHEYLGILRLNDSKYQISSKVNDWLKERNTDLIKITGGSTRWACYGFDANNTPIALTLTDTYQEVGEWWNRGTVYLKQAKGTVYLGLKKGQEKTVVTSKTSDIMLMQEDEAEGIVYFVNCKARP